VAIWKKANETEYAVKLIVFFTEAEKDKVGQILKNIDLQGTERIALVDARSDSNPSGSKA
jgi:hypothetical protein